MTRVLSLSFFAVAIAGCSAIIGADFDAKNGARAERVEPTEPSAEEETDASVDAAPPIAATSDSGATKGQACVGAATTCAAIATDTTKCALQKGCSFTPTSCATTFNCKKLFDFECNQTAPCTLDFSVNPALCRPLTGYCAGATKSACEAKATCAFSGGCGGTVIACAAITNEAGCKTQAGCTWQ